MPQVMTIPSTPVVLFLSLIIPHLLTLPSLIFAGDPLFRSCSAGENDTSPSLYASNLQILLSNLISNTPKTKTLFFQDSVPVAKNQTIFGLAQCRPDTTVAGCTDCLTGAATSAMNGSCKSASVRSEYCVLRYEDREFSSFAEDLGFVSLYGVDMAANPVQYRRQVRELLEGLCVEAKNGAMKIAAGVKRSEMNGGDVYGLAWCTMDLSPEACYRCLDKGLKSYDASNLDYYIGGGSITASCIVTYNDYAFLNISLIQEFSRSPTHNGTDSTIGQRRGRQTQKLITAASITASISSAAIVLAIFLIRRRRLAIQKASELDVEDDIRTVESHLVPIVRLKAATNDFSNENKLGEGRFGPVYKGLLWDGRQVAVKRLSKTYGQGLVELRNEAALVAQLQHKNLVKLLGCCMEEDEKLLVYEYLPNASLDKHLYDPVGRAQLDWRRRHSIIEGIARGLVYMHDHSRVRIIHRNLNANNILLDGDMNPKISDFGLAKLVGAGESQWNTKQFAGKSGYMAPEYAARGEFSAKSDVFSYGMVVLEIITGRRNGSFVEVGNSLNLQTYVWQHWNEGISEQVIDKGLAGQYQVEDVLRCVNIGLLCIQADPEERPSMASVVLMLSTSSEMLPAPAMPAYYTGENLSSKSSESSGQTNCDDFHVMDQLIGSSREQDSMQAR